MEYLRFCCSSSYLQCQWNSELQFTNCFTQNHRVIKLSVSNVMAVNSCSLLDRKLCSLTSMCCGGQWHPPPRGDHWKHVHFKSVCRIPYFSLWTRSRRYGYKLHILLHLMSLLLHNCQCHSTEGYTGVTRTGSLHFTLYTISFHKVDMS